MKYTLLASGSKGNACLIQDENLNLLIDCGTTKKYLLSCFETLGFEINDLDAVFITHDHTDHISQIKLFKEKPIYSPIEISNIPTIPIKADQPFQLQHLMIRPIGLSHDAEHTTGYIIESWDEKLVYITDTGYVKEKYYDSLKNADYIILESNHDVESLMKTHRPSFVKARIQSDSGHLCNEDSARILGKILSKNTKQIVLAHISEEANTREKALEVSANYLLEKYKGQMNKDLIVCASEQFKMIKGGNRHEKVDMGNYCRTIGLEQLANIPSRK
ncbi:MAG: MBL fold metallo-hydrolase [Solobacterium sp.]|nr:MBL fold metallo-hydrolase [Solobacterium sp.]